MRSVLVRYTLPYMGIEGSNFNMEVPPTETAASDFAEEKPETIPGITPEGGSNPLTVLKTETTGGLVGEILPPDVKLPDMKEINPKKPLSTEEIIGEEKAEGVAKVVETRILKEPYHQKVGGMYGVGLSSVGIMPPTFSSEYIPRNILGGEELEDEEEEKRRKGILKEAHKKSPDKRGKENPPNKSLVEEKGVSKDEGVQIADQSSPQSSQIEDMRGKV